MTIKEEMVERRNKAREQIEDELQREVEKTRKFAEDLQKEDSFSTKFSFDVYESGDSCLIVGDSSENTLYLNLANKTMKPQLFKQFLKERLKEEGVELTDEKFEISLL